ncbi:MAG: peroxiredoxin [SAR202 cluster bacterium]|nr:peroxiredoxin [SAR202 cluster bacterium]
MLKVHTPAPPFSGTLTDGTAFDLASERGRRHVVLYFFPKAFTPGCTKETCRFRDGHDAVTRSGALVLGISGDDIATLRRFRDQYGAPFQFMSDHGKRVARSYDVRRTLGLGTSRVTYVVGADGLIHLAHHDEFRMNSHLDAVLATLEGLPAVTPNRA